MVFHRLHLPQYAALALLLAPIAAVAGPKVE